YYHYTFGCYLFCFSFLCNVHHLYLYFFPTRRSSDLKDANYSCIFVKIFYKMNTRGRNNGNRNNKKSSFSKDGSQDKKTTGSKFGKFSKPLPKAEKPVANKPLVAKDDAMRLNKYIANSGVCSRRDADLYIQSGNVTVNGEVVTEMGYKVKPTDKVVFDGVLLNPEKKV